MKNKHIPVLLQESIVSLEIKPGITYVDLTYGGGGHFRKAMQEADEQGTFIGLDADSQAISQAVEEFSSLGFEAELVSEETWSLRQNHCQLYLAHRNFAELEEVLKVAQLEKVDAILADLGTSTNQLTQAGRGFSFLLDEELDMRMDESLQVSARDLVNALYKKELEQLFENLADISFANQLAKEIIAARKQKPITSTYDLRKIVQKVVPHSKRTGTNKHPEAKVFQALRIAVNNELNHLRSVLPLAFRNLSLGGKLAVISFHSGEDRIVKTFFTDLVRSGQAQFAAKRVLPSTAEVASNPASRSARLRCIERIINNE